MTLHQKPIMKKILVVDDQPEIRKLIRLTIGSKFEVLEAANAEEASACLTEQRPDLILLDVMMPGIDGLDWCHMIKKVAKLDNLRIIIVSSKTQLQDYADALSVGAEGYVAKPFSPAALLAKIEELLATAPATDCGCQAMQA